MTDHCHHTVIEEFSPRQMRELRRMLARRGLSSVPCQCDQCRARVAVDVPVTDRPAAEVLETASHSAGVNA